MPYILAGFYTVGGLALLGLFSAGLSLGLHVFKPRWSRRLRILGGSLAATAIPMSVPFAGLALEGDLGMEHGVLAWLALAVLSILVWAICALPASWWAVRRIDRSESGASLPAATQSDLAQGEGQPKLVAADG